MKRDIAPGAGLLALLALAIHTLAPPAGEQGGPSGKSQHTPQNQPAKPAADEKTAREGPWLATRSVADETPAFELPETADKLDPILKGISSAAGPNSAVTASLTGLFGLSPANYDITPIVATVADPLHTRLAAFFDRQIEALERAAEAKGWVFTSQWLPWLDHFDASEPDINERRHQRFLEDAQEQIPGILIFRPAKPVSGARRRLLLVFLVPESPTSGIATAPFYSALNMANLLSAHGSRIGLLAPSFSGSFQSLSGLMKGWMDPAFANRTDRVHNHVFGGSPSSASGADYFTASLKGLTNTNGGFDFYSGVVSSEAGINALKTVLPKFGLSTSDSALLIEGESGFGEDVVITRDNLPGVASTPDGLPIYRFPRDIAHLRDAYQQATGSGQTHGLQPTVDFSLRDSALGEDSIPVFSDVHTAASQGAVLSLIADDFKRKKIRLAYLAATNPLDSIFLATFMRRQAPETRILIGTDADVLFLSASQQQSLTGTLFFSTYPMFVQGNDWLRPPAAPGRTQSPNSHLVMPSENYRALFNVGQLLIGQLTNTPSDTDPSRLRGYGAFTKDLPASDFPGLWLFSLTGSGFAPVDWINPYADTAVGNLLWPVQHVTAASRTYKSLEERFKSPEPPLDWFVASWAFAVAILTVCACIALANFAPRSSLPLWLAVRSSYAARLPELAGLCFSLSMTAWVFLCPAPSSLEASFLRESTLFILRAASMAPLLTLTAVSCASVVRVSILSEWKSAIGPALLSLIYFSCYLYAINLWKVACGGIRDTVDQGDFLFRLRALDITAGASPAVPLLLLALLFSVSFFCYFYRCSKASDDRPRLNFPDPAKATDAVVHHAGTHDAGVHTAAHDRGLPDTEALDTDLFRHNYDSLNRTFPGPLGMHLSDSLLRALACLSITILGVAFLQLRLRSFERLPVNELLIAAIGVWIFALTGAILDITSAWKRLLGMLLLAELTPLRNAFDRVSKSWPRSPAWSLRQPVSSQVIAGHAVKALHDLNVSGQEARKHEDNAYSSEDLRKFVRQRYSTSHKTTEDWLKAVRNHEQKVAEIALKCYGRLTAEWANIAVGEQAPEPIPPSTAIYIDCLADFVALQLCNYFIYAMRHIRRMGMVISFAMLMVLLVLSSYSLQEPLAVGRFLAVAWLVVSVMIFYVFAGMERNWVLSKIARTRPGELDSRFWLQILGMGALPLLAVLGHLFPSIANFLYSWVTPSINALQ